MVKSLDILIVDDNIEDCELYSRLVHEMPQATCQCSAAGDGNNALKALRAQHFDCVLLDSSLPGINGLDVLKSIRSQWPFLPIILLSGNGSELLAAEFIKYGANDYLTKPVADKARLHSAIIGAINRSAKDRNSARPKLLSLLIVDDSPDDRETCIRSLKKTSNSAYRIVEASSGLTALKYVESEPFDCVLLDYSIPDMDGLEVLKHTRARRPFLAVILLTGQGNETIAVEAIKEGAYTYCAKSSINAEVLHQAISDAVYHGLVQRVPGAASRRRA